jgi:hypothetical protein
LWKLWVLLLIQCTPPYPPPLFLYYYYKLSLYKFWSHGSLLQPCPFQIHILIPPFPVSSSVLESFWSIL